MTKRCSSCKLYKDPEREFFKNRCTRDGYQNACNACKAILNRNWKYALKSGELAAMKARQNNQCAICGRSEDLVIDHDHKTGKLRELLCRLCNSLLGMCDDNQDTLVEALQYLRKWEAVAA